MSRRLLLRDLSLMSILLLPSAANAIRYADVLVQHSPVCGCPGTDPNAVLGSPDFGIAGQPNFGLVEFAEVDALTPGFVVVGFSGAPVPDLPGDDITIHLADWALGGPELFEVLASADGISFVSLGNSGPPSGSGNTPFGVSFDLSVGGLASAGFVKILNGSIDPGCCEGPDLDAISAVPEPTAASLLALGLVGISLRARRRRIE